MANPEHVEIVKGGVDAITEWRERNPDELLDLSGAELAGIEIQGVDLEPPIFPLQHNFSGADLRGANLGHTILEENDFKNAILVGADFTAAQLQRIDLDGADLSNAQLTQADLSGASLEGAVLRQAFLWRADLTGAYLRNADLTEALLGYANLSDANACFANLTDARLNRTVLGDLDLSGAVGLESIQHIGPSVIDERTLRRSWPLPEVFLRGVGLSDQYIEYFPSLMNQAIEFYSCFISYSSKDDEFASRLHADLQDNGVRCWFAPEDLRIGDKFRARIDEAIRLHDKLLLILSEDSVQSEWVESEVEAAFEREQRTKRTVLFPIRLDAAVMETDAAWAAEIRRTRHIGDFTAWKDHDEYQKAFERLMRDLKSGAEPRPAD